LNVPREHAFLQLFLRGRILALWQQGVPQTRVTNPAAGRESSPLPFVHVPISSGILVGKDADSPDFSE
jgi:hypothetical protein